MKVKSLSRVRLFASPWTVAYQASPSMGFSRQEFCSGLPFPSPGDLPVPGIEPGSPTLEADALTSEPPEKMVYMHLHNEISEYPSYFISRHLLMVTMLKTPVFSDPQTHCKFLSLHTLAHTSHSPRNVCSCETGEILFVLPTPLKYHFSVPSHSSPSVLGQS